jgi:hypothetical protein
MNGFHSKSFSIVIERPDPGQVGKDRFPPRYGTYSEILTADHEFRFNLNGEIKFIRGLDPTWPHPADQLKRTDGNDWVYYTVGDDSSDRGLISWMGEYYLPCLPYPSNAVWEINYASNPRIMAAFAAWSQLYADLHGAQKARFQVRERDLIQRILAHHDGVLFDRATELAEITGGRASVLPPDTRHVDYEVIPLWIADGCRYRCRFCCVKSDQSFRVRAPSDIREQVRRLKTFYGRNLRNYPALFLGNHDALAAGESAILTAVTEAGDALGLGGPMAREPFLFMFGSVDAFLEAGPLLFEKLDDTPFYTYINIGLESVDGPTLKAIGKPVDPLKVREAFLKMLEINLSHANLEVTANFLIGQTLSADHDQALAELLGDAPVLPQDKGTVYLSPLKDSPKKRELLPRVYEVQARSRLPVFVYLIQRL